MPSRRSLLAASGSAAAAVLSGCSALQEADGTPARLVAPDIEPDDADLIASGSDEVTNCPRGDVELQGRVFRLQTGDLVACTRVNVLPGASECDSDWRHSGVDVTQDWAADRLGPPADSGVAEFQTNAEFTDESDADVYVNNVSGSDTGEWELRLREGRGFNQVYAARSRFAGAEDLAVGDPLADVSAEVPMSTGSPFGDSATESLSTTLTVGDTEA